MLGWVWEEWDVQHTWQRWEMGATVVTEYLNGRGNLGDLIVVGQNSTAYRPNMQTPMLLRSSRRSSYDRVRDRDVGSQWSVALTTNCQDSKKGGVSRGSHSLPVCRPRVAIQLPPNTRVADSVKRVTFTSTVAECLAPYKPSLHVHQVFVWRTSPLVPVAAPSKE
jgi:hypothetical protein